MGDQRRALEEELIKVKAQEEEVENELRVYFSALSDGRSLQSKGLAFESADLSNNINKIVGFSQNYEAMEQDAKKLSAQVDDCRALSDRLSLIGESHTSFPFLLFLFVLCYVLFASSYCENLQ